MHENEVATDAALVRALLQSQFPQWAELPISRVESAGTDNAMYRLGAELAVRLPRIDWAVDNVAKEQRWLPVLAPSLPLAVPLPVARGVPEQAFPYPWGVVEWLPGDHPVPGEAGVEVALALATFVRALQKCDAGGGPQHFRGGPVRRGDAVIRASVAKLDGEVDGDAVLALWDEVLRAPDYDGPKVWFHGDLSYLNLLMQNGRLHGAIDWGTCAVGDPAIEMVAAWSMFAPEERTAYRDALEIDDAMWLRGKGWVLNGVVGIPYYRDTNPILVADKVRAINAVLADR
jgi:aminoglycoside phosphotransferase (APT) family kinase protein